MGSIEKANITGFLCRLCSEMHRVVIHIYGDQGKKQSLVDKINGYLPITISPTDPLPKTICKTCMKRVEQHYELLMRLSRIHNKALIADDKDKAIFYVDVHEDDVVGSGAEETPSNTLETDQSLSNTISSTSDSHSERTE